MTTQKCHLIEKTPDRTDLVPLDQHFTLLKTFTKESHLWRYLLKCRSCEQLYFYEFYEEIDWSEGKDPQYCTFIPVKSRDEAEVLSKKSVMDLLGIIPRLQNDLNQNGIRSIVWINE
jgi:hypothetical protein